MIVQSNNKKDIKDPQINISLSSLQDLEQVDTYKYLGVILDKKLTWVIHIQCICKKLAQSLGIIRKIKRFTTRSNAFQYVLLIGILTSNLWNY